MNPSAVAVTVKIEKRITFTETETGVAVESGGLTEFPIAANDEITFDFDLLFSELAILLKANSTARVDLYLAGARG